MVILPQVWFKGIVRSFELRCEIRLNRFVMTNWRLGNFFYFILKGQHHQISKKTNRCRLITFKVTLTGQSHFIRIFLLRKVTLRGNINSVKWTPHPQASVSPPSWTKGGGTPSPAVEGPIRTTGEKAWHSVYSVDKRQKKHKIRQPNEFYCTLYTVQCTVALTQ